jgi:hypothetical protein
MNRFLLFSLFTLFILAMSAPAFACAACQNDFSCNESPGSGTFCIEHYDYCEERWGCSGVAARDTLAASLTIASVEVITPAGIRQANDASRLAVREPVTRNASPVVVR